jgi:hypothetical protein
MEIHMTLLQQLGAFVRARLIPEARAFYAFWSVRFATIGAALYAWLLSDPVGAQVAWQQLPAEYRALLPDHLVRWITAILFVLVLVARVTKQSGQGGATDGR